MQVNITFRGMESTESLKTFVNERVEHLTRYFDKPVEAHAVLSLERYLHHADVTVQAGHYVLRGRVKTEDMYKSIEGAIEKIEKQLKRYREKMRSTKLRGRDEDHVRVRHNVIETPVHGDDADWSINPKIVRTDELMAKPMSVNEAIMQMDLLDSSFLVYKNAEDGGLNVVYRRTDGHLGVIESPQPSPASAEKAARSAITGKRARPD